MPNACFLKVPCRCQACLALPLLVLCVFADHANHPAAVRVAAARAILEAAAKYRELHDLEQRLAALEAAQPVADLAAARSNLQVMR